MRQRRANHLDALAPEYVLEAMAAARYDLVMDAHVFFNGFYTLHGPPRAEPLAGQLGS